MSHPARFAPVVPSSILRASVAFVALVACTAALASQPLAEVRVATRDAATGTEGTGADGAETDEVVEEASGLEVAGHRVHRPRPDRTRAIRRRGAHPPPRSADVPRGSERLRPVRPWHITLQRCGGESPEDPAAA